MLCDRELDTTMLQSRIEELEGLNNALREQSGHLFWLAWQGDYSDPGGASSCKMSDLIIRAGKDGVSTAESAKLFLEELADDQKLQEQATQCMETSSSIHKSMVEHIEQLVAADAIVAHDRGWKFLDAEQQAEHDIRIAVYDARRLCYTCHVCEKLMSERESYSGIKGDVCKECLDREGS